MRLPVEGTENAAHDCVSIAGAPANPGRYHDLIAAGHPTMERGTRTLTVRVRELAGDEQDQVDAE